MSVAGTRRLVVGLAASIGFAAGALGVYVLMRAARQTEVARATQVRVDFESSPPGAIVSRAGAARPLGVTPFGESFARSECSETFEFRAADDRAARVSVPLREDARVTVALAPRVATIAAPQVPAAASIRGTPPPVEPIRRTKISVARSNHPAPTGTAPRRESDSGAVLDPFEDSP